MKPTIFSSARTPQARRYRIVSGPARQPLRTEAQRLRRLQQGEADATRGKQLFLLGNLVPVIQPRDHGNDQWCMRKPRTVFFDRGNGGMGVEIQYPQYQCFTQRVARVAVDAQETEWHQLAVIGDARGRCNIAAGVVIGAGGPSCLKGWTALSRNAGVGRRHA